MARCASRWKTSLVRFCISSDDRVSLRLTSVIGAVILAAPFAWGDGAVIPPVPDAAHEAQVVFLGERHDNAAHHAVQAAWVEALAPKALVFEMLTADQARRATPEARRDAARLEESLGWTEAGWPDFAMYFPIFEAAPEAAVIGASVPRSQVRGLMQQDLGQVVDAATREKFGLGAPLPAAQQSAREALQRAAHCDALPDTMLPMMVDVQRLRDAALADAALAALSQTGGPVVVITGNGHAREDWGAPYLTRFAAPDVAVFTLGQGEVGQFPDGGFSQVVDGPAVDRGDPCDAFK